MASGENGRASFPWGLVLVCTIATLFVCTGVVRCLMPDLVPALARPMVAWSLIGVGILLDFGAIFHFVSSKIPRT